MSKALDFPRIASMHGPHELEGASAFAPTGLAGGASGGGSTAMVAARTTEGGTPMPKLTDTQLVMLSAAAQRTDGVVELPDEF